MKKDKTFAAIAKLQDVEVELHRLKNALDMANRALASPRREWQGLTEQEIKDCEKQAMVNGALPFEQRSFFASAIEVKLKEKNT